MYPFCKTMQIRSIRNSVNQVSTLLTHKSAKLTKIKYGPNQKKCSIFSVKECSWMGNQLFKYLVSLFQHILITIISWSSANRSLFQIFRLHGFQAHRESNFRTCRCLHHQGQILKKSIHLVTLNTCAFASGKKNLNHFVLYLQLDHK